QVNRLGFATRSFGSSIVIDVFWCDDDLDGGGLIELLEFLRRVLCLRWPAAAEDMDFLGLILLPRLVDIVWNFGDYQLIGGVGQNARDIQRHVADADNSDGLGAQVPFALKVRVAVVKAHKLSGAKAAVELFTR